MVYLPTDRRGSHLPRNKILGAVLLFSCFVFLSGILFHDQVPLQNIGLSSYIRSDPSCPSSLRPRRQLTFSSSQGSTCVYPNVTAPELFEASICYDPAICNAFSLKVWRKDLSTCLNGPDRPLSHDPELSAAIAAEYGPDDYRLDVRGAELLSTSFTELKDCAYRFDVALQNAGVADIQVFLLHSNWIAFDEVDTSYPKNTHMGLLTEPFLLHPCSSSCSESTLVPLPLPKQTEYHSAIELPTTDHIPACSSSMRHSLPASYLPRIPRLLDGYYNDPFPLIKAHGLPPYFVGRYGSRPDGCAWKHDGMRFSSHKNCNWEQPRKIEFIGDSHARVAFDSMHHRLAGNYDYSRTSEKVGDKGYTIGNTDFHFLWDPFGEHINSHPDFSCDKISEMAGLVVSIGTHSACFRGTVANYTASLAFIERIAACPAPLPPLLFLLAPPVAPRDDGGRASASTYGDQRTTPRLLWFNRIAEELALKKTLVWKVVDQFSLLRPFEEYPLKTDKTHFLSTDGLEGVLDEMIGKMEICGPDLS